MTLSCWWACIAIARNFMLMMMTTYPRSKKKKTYPSLDIDNKVCTEVTEVHWFAKAVLLLVCMSASKKALLESWFLLCDWWDDEGIQGVLARQSHKEEDYNNHGIGDYVVNLLAALLQPNCLKYVTTCNKKDTQHAWERGTGFLQTTSSVHLYDNYKYVWLWLIMAYYFRLCLIISDYFWLILIISDYFRLFLILSDYVWFFPIMSDYGWLFLIMNDYFWLILMFFGLQSPVIRPPIQVGMVQSPNIFSPNWHY